MCGKYSATPYYVHCCLEGEVVDEVPLTTAVQDNNSHTSVDDLHFSCVAGFCY